MFNLFKKKKEEIIIAPTNGELIPLSEVNDEAFSKGMMGTGFAIKPKINSICALVDGIVTFVFQTGHAIGITSNGGLEILIHIGIDTVDLDGKGFKVCVKQGDVVKKGDIIVEVDLEYLCKQGKVSDCIVIFPNNDQITILKNHQEVKQGETNFIKVNKRP